MAGIKDTKIIKGQPHLLTYITPNEVKKLKALGGQETMTPEGIPAYPEYDNYGFSSQADFDSGDVSKSNDPNVRGEGPGQNRVTASSLAAANRIEAQQKELKKIREEKERQALKKQLENGPVTNYSTNYFVNANRSGNKKVNKLRQKLMQDYIRRTKDSNLEELGMIDSQGMTIGGIKVPSLFTGAASAFKVDPNTKYFDEGSIREIGSQLQYTPTTDPITGKTTYGMTSNQTKTLGDLKQDIQFENNPNISKNDFNEYMNRNKIFNDGPSDDSNQPYLPINYNTGAATIEDAEPYNQFTYDENAFGPGGDSANVRRGSYDFNQGGRAGKAEGGIMELRARRAFGGIMDRVTGRKAYGLGSIFKSVKKAASKVLKSDIGKAALLYAGGVYLGGGNIFSPGDYNPAKFFGNKASGGYFANMGGGLSSLGKKFGFEKLGPNASLGDKAMKYAKLFGLGYGLSKTKLGEAPVDQMPGGGERGGRLKDSQGNEALPVQLRAEIDDAYESGDPERIAAIEKYYAFLPPTAKEMPYEEFGEEGYRTTVATGGRIGYNGGGSVITLMDGTKVQIPAGSYNSSGSLKDRIYSSSKGDLLREEIVRKLSFANGGRIGKAEGGLMDLGGMEKDYRAEGGFVPIGEYEKKDDVPARLSVNEFVFTADAVRGAGQGDIDKGAEIMENMMENLENGGTVSEESQGNKGAQQMFETSQRLGEVV